MLCAEVKTTFMFLIRVVGIYSYICDAYGRLFVFIYACLCIFSSHLFRTDITPPVVTLNPPNPQFLQGGTTWVDPGATAWDSADGTINVITRTPTRPNSFLLQPQNVCAIGTSD